MDFRCSLDVANFAEGRNAKQLVLTDGMPE